MTGTATGYPHLQINESDGFPIVTRLDFKGIHLIANHIAHGWSAEELVINFPQLTLGEVYSVLGWYADHREFAAKALDQKSNTVRASALENRHCQIAVKLKEREAV